MLEGWIGNRLMELLTNEEDCICNKTRITYIVVLHIDANALDFAVVTVAGIMFTKSTLGINISIRNLLLFQILLKKKAM
jgi:hypothetical protein